MSSTLNYMTKPELIEYTKGLEIRIQELEAEIEKLRKENGK